MKAKRTESNLAVISIHTPEKHPENAPICGISPVELHSV